MVAKRLVILSLLALLAAIAAHGAPPDPDPGWRVARKGIGNLRAVAWGGGSSVAVGEGGEIWTSPDGRAWTPAAAAPFASSPAAFAWNGRVHVAVGPGGQMLVSADAVEWEAQASGVTTDLRGLAWGAGTFVPRTVPRPTATKRAPVQVMA